MLYDFTEATRSELFNALDEINSIPEPMLSPAAYLEWDAIRAELAHRQEVRSKALTALAVRVIASGAVAALLFRMTRKGDK